MIYKLVEITDLNGVDKTSEDCVNRIGRNLKLNADNIALNRRLMMVCIDGFEKSILTSYVKKVEKKDDTLTITTENSIYYLVDKDVYDEEHFT